MVVRAPAGHEITIKIMDNMIPSEITQEKLNILADLWFDRLGETKDRRTALNKSAMPHDIVADRRNDRLQTFLNHYFLQPDFNQEEYDRDPTEYIRSHSMQIIPELSRDRMTTLDHSDPVVEHLSWAPNSTIEDIGKYLGLGIHTEGGTPIMTIENILLEKISKTDRSKLTGFV